MNVLGVTAIAVSAAAWVIPARTASPADGSSPMIVGMGGGMMGGGMMGGGIMGGYEPNGSYGRNPQQGSADLNSRAGKIYAQTCNRCHALPDPQQHTAQQWPAVVARMEQHMRDARQPLPEKDEIKEIDTFLAQHANGRK